MAVGAMRRLWPLITLLAACTAATPPYRGPGPAPINAADRELLRLVELYLDLNARIDPLLKDSGGPTKWLERWPADRTDGLTERARIAKQTRRDLLPIDESAFSEPYRIDRRRLLREVERDLIWARFLERDELIAKQLALAGETSTAALHARALAALEEKIAPLEIELPSEEVAREIAAAGPEVTLLRRARPYRPAMDAWPAVRSALDKHGDRSAYRTLAALAVVDLEAHSSTTAAAKRLRALIEISPEKAAEIIDRPGAAAEAFYTAERLIPIVRSKGNAVEKIFAGGWLPPDLLH